jgi:hypothetical protein
MRVDSVDMSKKVIFDIATQLKRGDPQVSEVSELNHLYEERRIIESRIEIEKLVRKSDLNGYDEFTRKIRNSINICSVSKNLNKAQNKYDAYKNELRKAPKQSVQINLRKNAILAEEHGEQLSAPSLAEIYGHDNERIEKKDENIDIYLNSILDDR